MKNYSLSAKINNLKYSSLYYVKKNKTKLFVLLFIFIFALITGILTVTKYLEMGSLSKDFLLFDYVDNDFKEFSSLLNRFLSASFILLVISLSSLTIILLPISLLVWIYRSYLIGYNCAILILCYGFNGLITSLIVIIPCQIVLSGLFLVFFCLSLTKLKERKNKCYSGFSVSFFKMFLIFMLLILIISLIEFILLLLFNANVILVI